MVGFLPISLVYFDDILEDFVVVFEVEGESLVLCAP